MNIQKTKFDSYCLRQRTSPLTKSSKSQFNGFAEGCKYCVKGEKLVLFMTGICKRGCWYCSLSKKRKNQNEILANERECKNIREVIQEVKDSNATSAGITGGDPLLCLNKTIEYASALKKEFGKKFHIHIYLTTQFVTKDKLQRLSKCVDEVRFHPSFLVKENEKEEDAEKIKLAKSIFGISNVGIEMPMIPEKKREIFDFILRIEKDISFVNLNEFELSETNFSQITKKYTLKEGGYVVSGSLEAGKWILNELSKRKTKLKVHLCTADLKNHSQFVNRLKKHKIFKYGKRTEDGTVIYLVVNKKLNLEGTIYDEKKKRTILSEEIARKLLTFGKEKIIRVEEYPTYDRIEVEEEEL